jgi:hypothetical protein
LTTIFFLLGSEECSLAVIRSVSHKGGIPESITDGNLKKYENRLQNCSRGRLWEKRHLQNLKRFTILDVGLSVHNGGRQSNHPEQVFHI